MFKSRRMNLVPSFIKDFIAKQITITAMDFIGHAKDPRVKPITNFTREQLLAGELVFNCTNGCWCLERKTTGKIIDGTFYPNKGQSVQYTIAINKDNPNFNKPG